MDILDVIRRGLESLPDGEFENGMKAVLKHIEMAVCHLERGQGDGGPQLFTDAVYRCNQAYEGSIKEIYRVAARKNPAKIKTAVIEDYLEKQSSIRPRIVSQLNRYRQEWRNPSTHDYTLDFDENEAFLAIVNIAAFAKLAIDQIGSTLAFQEAEKASGSAPRPRPNEGVKLSLAQSAAIGTAVLLTDPPSSLKSMEYHAPEGSVASSVAGFLSGGNGEGNIIADLEPQISLKPIIYADLILRMGEEKAIVEFKRMTTGLSSLDRSVETISRYLDKAEITDGIVVIYSLTESVDYVVAHGRLENGKRLHFVLPESTAEEAVRKRPKLHLEVLELRFSRSKSG